MGVEKSIIEFPDEDDLILREIDAKSSIKSNIFISGSNFTDLLLWLSRFKKFAVYTYSLIDIENLLESVIARFQSNKTVLSILRDVAIGQIVTQISNGVTYEIRRVDSFTIEIVNLITPEWNVDNLMIQTKNAAGTFVYPTIKTFESKVTINFPDGIMGDYKLIMF